MTDIQKRLAKAEEHAVEQIDVSAQALRIFVEESLKYPEDFQFIVDSPGGAPSLTIVADRDRRAMRGIVSSVIKVNPRATLVYSDSVTAAVSAIGVRLHFRTVPDMADFLREHNLDVDLGLVLAERQSIESKLQFIDLFLGMVKGAPQ